MTDGVPPWLRGGTPPVGVKTRLRKAGIYHECHKTKNPTDGMDHERRVFHLRLRRHRVRALHQHLSDHLRAARHPGDRPGGLPVRQGVGLHGIGSQVRDPALYPDLHLRHLRRHHPGRARGLHDGGVPGKSGPSQAGGRGPAGGGPAGGHPLRGLRPDRHDGAGPRRAQGL